MGGAPPHLHQGAPGHKEGGKWHRCKFTPLTSSDSRLRRGAKGLQRLLEGEAVTSSLSSMVSSLSSLHSSPPRTSSLHPSPPPKPPRGDSQPSSPRDGPRLTRCRATEAERDPRFQRTCPVFRLPFLGIQIEKSWFLTLVNGPGNIWDPVQPPMFLNSPANLPPACTLGWSTCAT